MKLAQIVDDALLVVESNGDKVLCCEMSNLIKEGIWLAIDHGAYEAFNEKGEGKIAFHTPLKLYEMDKDKRKQVKETLAGMMRFLDEE